MCLRIKAFALTGRGDSTMRKPQGVASLALGYVLHWAFSPSLLNPKPQGVASLALGLCAPLGLQPVLAKSEPPGCRFACYVLHWAFIDIIGCDSAIQASLIAFALHDDSARPC